MNVKHHRPRSIGILSVKDRIDAVLQLQQREAPFDPLSVAEVCRRAGVNRANLYVTHPELVAQILRRPVNARGRSKPRDLPQERVRCYAQDEMRVQVKALLYICLELRAQVEKLESGARSGVRPADKKATRKSTP